jgi:hypothetical protein
VTSSSGKSTWQDDDPLPRRPHFGFTRTGHAVHLRTADHLPGATRYQRFNKAMALWIVAHVGTMTCFWLFCLLACLSLPAVLYALGWSLMHAMFGALTGAAVIGVVSWTTQNFIQLVLLPALMVGQNLQSAAADARSAKTFEDTEFIKGAVIAVAAHVGAELPPAA